MSPPGLGSWFSRAVRAAGPALGAVAGLVSPLLGPIGPLVTTGIQLGNGLFPQQTQAGLPTNLRFVDPTPAPPPPPPPPPAASFPWGAVLIGGAALLVLSSA